LLANAVGPKRPNNWHTAFREQGGAPPRSPPQVSLGVTHYLVTGLTCAPDAITLTYSSTTAPDRSPCAIPDTIPHPSCSGQRLPIPVRPRTVKRWLRFGSTSKFRHTVRCLWRSRDQSLWIAIVLPAHVPLPETRLAALASQSSRHRSHTRDTWQAAPGELHHPSSKKT
jgi:hypothetical protein